MSRIRVVLFDLGNVLIGWNPIPLMSDYIKDEAERAAFMPTFMEWNQLGDQGRWCDVVEPFAKACPAHKDFIEAYPHRYLEALTGIIDGTAALLPRLRGMGLKLYAASNWAADLFEIGHKDMPFLAHFDGMEISGQVKLVKPSAEFFHDMMKRFGFNADEAVFIDDLPANIAAAKAVGLTTIHFQSPEQLERDLVKIIGPIPGV